MTDKKTFLFNGDGLCTNPNKYMTILADDYQSYAGPITAIGKDGQWHSGYEISIHELSITRHVSKDSKPYSSEFLAKAAATKLMLHEFYDIIADKEFITRLFNAFISNAISEYTASNHQHK